VAEASTTRSAFKPLTLIGIGAAEAE